MRHSFMPHSIPLLSYIYFLDSLKKKKKRKANLHHSQQIYSAAQQLWGVIVPQKHTLFWPPAVEMWLTEECTLCVCISLHAQFQALFLSTLSPTLARVSLTSCIMAGKLNHVPSQEPGTRSKYIFKIILVIIKICIKPNSLRFKSLQRLNWN